jgi:DNA-nicking Smr family endonuclease
VARNRRKHRDREEADADAPAKLVKPPEVGTGLKALLERAGLSALPKKPEKPQKPARGAAPAGGLAAKAGRASGLGSAAHADARSAPPAPAPPVEKPRALYTTAELSALNQAYRGVEPIRRAQRKRKPGVPDVSPIRRRAIDPEDVAARARLAALVGGGVRFEVRWDDGFVQALRAGGASSALSRAGSARFEPEASLDLHGRQRAEAQRVLGEFVRAEHRRGVRRLLVIVGKGQHSEDGVGVLGSAAIETLTAGVAAPLVLAVASAHPALGGKGALAVVLR